MKSMNARFIALCSILLLCAASYTLGQTNKAQKKPVELADLVAGTYYGDVISDSKGSSRSDVTLTITKVDKRTVQVTSDYSRLGTVDVRLTRIGNKILNDKGDTVLLLDLAQQPPRLDYTPHGEVSYAGSKEEEGE